MQALIYSEEASVIVRRLESSLVEGLDLEIEELAEEKTPSDLFLKGAIEVIDTEISGDGEEGACLYSIYNKKKEAELKFALVSDKQVGYLTETLRKIYCDSTGTTKYADVTPMEATDFLITSVDERRAMKVSLVKRRRRKGKKRIEIAKLEIPALLMKKRLSKVDSFRARYGGVSIAVQTNDNKVYSAHYKGSQLISSNLIATAARLVGGIQFNESGAEVLIERSGRIEAWKQPKATDPFSFDKYISEEGDIVESDSSIMNVSSSGQVVIGYKTSESTHKLIVDALSSSPEVSTLPSEIRFLEWLRMNPVLDALVCADTSSSKKIYAKRPGEAVREALAIRLARRPKFYQIDAQITDLSMAYRAAGPFPVDTEFDDASKRVMQMTDIYGSAELYTYRESRIADVRIKRESLSKFGAAQQDSNAVVAKVLSYNENGRTQELLDLKFAKDWAVPYVYMAQW